MAGCRPLRRLRSRPRCHRPRRRHRCLRRRRHSLRSLRLQCCRPMRVWISWICRRSRRLRQKRLRSRHRILRLRRRCQHQQLKSLVRSLRLSRQPTWYLRSIGGCSQRKPSAYIPEACFAARSRWETTRRWSQCPLLSPGRLIIIQAVGSHRRRGLHMALHPKGQ